MPISEAVDFADAPAELYALRDPALVADGIARLARDAVACDDSAVSLVASRRRVRPAAGTSPQASGLVLAQPELGEGPGLAAIETGAPVACAELQAELRWPEWAERAAALGFRSSLSVPLFEGGRVFGLLLLLDDDPDHFDDDRVTCATTIARRSSFVLAAADRNEQLELALDARTVIGQAQGILMERYALDADTAFSVLRRYSQQGNTKLQLVAQRVVRDRVLPGVELAAS